MRLYFFHKNLIDCLPKFFNAPDNYAIISPRSLWSYSHKKKLTGIKLVLIALIL